MPGQQHWNLRTMIIEGKEMKTVDTAKMRDIARFISFKVMYAYMAALLIRFMRFYLSERLSCIYRSILTTFNCPNVRKRIQNKVVHDCKDTVHRRSPDSRPGLSGKRKPKYEGYNGFQRGLLEDNDNIIT